jgi:hypothetical protein
MQTPASEIARTWRSWAQAWPSRCSRTASNRPGMSAATWPRLSQRTSTSSSGATVCASYPAVGVQEI